MNRLLSLTALVLCLASALQPAAAFAQSTPNRYRAEFNRIYTLDFESGANPISALTSGVSMTSLSSEVVAGSRSVKLDGAAVYAQLPAAALMLQPGRSYMLTLRYRMLRPGRVGLALRTPGGGASEFIMLGELNANVVQSDISRSVRVPAGSGSTFLFYALDAAVTLDDIQVDAQVPRAWRASVPLLTAGFPRLGDYMLLSPATIAMMHHDDPDEGERVAARFDLLVGPGADSYGGGAWIRELRAANPAIKILPYRQAFMAQFTGSPGLEAEFNAGLAESWFMRSTTSSRLSEPLYPQNVQLNHTLLAPTVNGLGLADYSTSFLSRRVLSTGLWDGVQFDQAEWYVNPLLGEPPPPIDLDRNGTADAYSDVQREWAKGFAQYFKTINTQFGFSQLTVGNAGYLPSNPSALAAMNGWIAERVEPYKSDAAGNWLTGAGSNWYRLLNNYLLAGRLSRAPQMPLLEFTGTGLGVPTGETTPNGMPMRSRAMTAADYRRMRLGLTTALLGNGFFEYDLVDNTTPALWFDEYAVSNIGTATTDLSGKGYLGQPLGDAEELPYASRTLFNLDFETASLPASTYVNGRLSTLASEVVSGSSSLVVSKTSTSDFAWFVWSAGQVVPGRSYQLRADFRVLSMQPTTHQGLLGLGFIDEYGQLPTERTGSLFMPDVDGPGQQGTLRASIKATAADQVLGMLFDIGTVAIDNLQLIEGTGGVWRRDFESGIVLVNPTPESLTVSLAQIAGARNRTGIRRILGSQQASWNNGQAIAAAGITIPSGDGIVLLANRIGAAALIAPAAPVLTSAGTTLTAQWSPAGGYPAGYQVIYGEEGAHLTRVAAAGRDARVSLDGLLPGATYYVRVAAFDFNGNVGPASAVRSITMPGVEPAGRPVFTLYSAALVPGAVSVISGSNLADSTLQPSLPLPTRAAGTRIEVNGVEAPLYWISPSAIAFVTPWEVAGSDAVINVFRGSIPGRERLAPMRAALPQLIASSTPGTVLALHADGSAVTASAPARRGEVIDILAFGLGAVTDPPANGVAPATGSTTTTLAVPAMTIGGMAAGVTSVKLQASMIGVYRISAAIPAAAAPGVQPLQLSIAGEISNVLNIAVQ